MVRSIFNSTCAIAFFLLTSCYNQTDKNALARIPETVEMKANLTVKSKLDEAKEILRTIAQLNNYSDCVNHPVKCPNFRLQHVEKGEPKPITKKEIVIMRIPLEKRLDSLRLLLTEKEKNELNTYNTHLVHELIETVTVLGDTCRFLPMLTHHSCSC